MTPSDRYRPPTRTESTALESELLFMRKGAGFTPVRLAKAPRLRQALGGDDQPYEVHRERFVSAVQSLHEPEPELLLAVYGLAPETEGMASLNERRRYCGQAIGRGVYTVADREVPAVEHLRAQLITGWYPKSPLSMRVPESHNGVVQEFVTIKTIIEDTRWLETHEHYRILAAFDQAEYFTISSTQANAPIPEGEDFTVRTRRIGNSFSHQFWHKTPMRRGQFYDLRFRREAGAEHAGPKDLVEESRGFHEPTRYASFEVVFCGEKPRIAWRYERLTFLERPGEPDPASLLDYEGDSLCTRFHDLYGGLHHGIAWAW